MKLLRITMMILSLKSLHDYPLNTGSIFPFPGNGAEGAKDAK